MPLTVGSLFSGIGGLDLAFERAGFTLRWMCEKDDYCKKILRKHWPHTPIYDDVRSLYRSPLQDSRWPEPVDVLIGGFPCQDISLAGKGAGLDGERSGLWWEFERIIRVVRPRYAVLENVPALVHRGLPAVLGALAEDGYDAEWQIVSAAAVGAPHLRERIFIVAYPRSLGRGGQEGARGRVRDENGHSAGQVRRRSQQQLGPPGHGEGAGDVAHANGQREQQSERTDPEGGGWIDDGYKTTSEPATDTNSRRRRAGKRDILPRESNPLRSSATMADATGERRHATRSTGQAVFGPRTVERLARCRQLRGIPQWESEPAVGRLANGVSHRVDRLRGLGNAVVPIQGELVAHCVREHAEHLNLW